MSEAQDNGRIDRIAELETTLRETVERVAALTGKEVCGGCFFGPLREMRDTDYVETRRAKADVLYAVNQARRATEKVAELRAALVESFDLRTNRHVEEREAAIKRTEAAEQRSRELLDALDMALGKCSPDVSVLRGAAFQQFWAWQEVSGHIDRGSSLYCEVEACIEEAFRLGTIKAERDLGEARAEVQRLSCRRCHGKGTVPTSCDDPQCGDSTWDHECGLDGDEPCQAVECVAARALLARLRPAPEKPKRCPRCDSPSPRLHPAVQHEGEVSVCPDPWHEAAPGGEKP